MTLHQICCYKRIRFIVLTLSTASLMYSFIESLARGNNWHPYRTPLVGAERRQLATSSEEPRKHVYFLKTHKCASTTIQRIFLRYGLSHNLSIALPLKDENVFYPDVFRPEIVKRTKSHPHMDIMAAHTRYNISAQAYMPNDTLFISVVRDPAEQMESAYYYFYLHSCNKTRNSTTNFEDYMEGLSRLTASNLTLDIDYPCATADLRFLQLYDFGLTLVPPPTADDVAQKIREIDKSFHLVLIVGKIDQGLILMRDMLKWTTADILYLKSNIHVRDGDALSNATRARAYAWNWADKMLYDHFNAKMESMIELQKDYIDAEVLDFRRQLETFYDYCIQTGNDTGSEPAASESKQKYIETYALSDNGKRNYACRIVAMSELRLFKHINCLQPEVVTLDPSHGYASDVAVVWMNASEIQKEPKRPRLQKRPRLKQKDPTYLRSANCQAAES